MAPAAVTGLAAEAAIARAAGLHTVVGGGDAARTAAAVERVLGDGATALISFGICGGLDPALASGTLLLPRVARDEAGVVYDVDPIWRGRLERDLRGAGIVASTSAILGASGIAVSPADKAALFRQHGAAAVDLESHIVAAAARRRGVPFIVLRAIADDAARAVPPAALVGLGETGRPAYRAVLRSIARRPAQVPGLLRLALDTRRALTALRRAVSVLARAGVA